MSTRAERAEIAARHAYVLVGLVRDVEPNDVAAYIQEVGTRLPDVVIALAAMVDPDAKEPLGWTDQFLPAPVIRGRDAFQVRRARRMGLREADIARSLHLDPRSLAKLPRAHPERTITAALPDRREATG